MNPAEYWRQQAESAAHEYDTLLQQQRDEIQRLQKRCSELLHERSMMKAATAEDVRGFCLNYQATQQQRNGLCTSSSVNEIPVNVLLQFLHEYSNGLVPQPESVRKRNRAAAYGSMPGTPQQHRLYQRMMARQRLNGREDDMEEWVLQQQQPQQSHHQDVVMHSEGNSHLSSGSADAGIDTDGSSSNVQQWAQGGRGDGGGGGGPVISAAAFGLPPLPPS